MKKILLTQGKYALVDDDDFEYLSQWRWFYKSGYAVRTQHVRLGINKYASNCVRMHRLINGTPVGFVTDHINRNKLDNRRVNLRAADKSLNSFNRDKPESNTSGHKGVYWDSWSQRWRAEIKVMYKKITLGRYEKLEDAVKARAEGELKYAKV